MGDQRPALTFDLDGVLCRPPLGINPGRGRDKPRDRAGSKSLLWRTERWRYALRRPMPGAPEGFLALAERFDCTVVTARADHARGITERWFERYFGVVPSLRLRPDWRETPAQFKVRTLRELSPLAHFEDDPHTALWVAEFLPAVFLVDWWRNRWLRGDRIHRVTRLADSEATLASLVAVRPPAPRS